MDTNQVDFVFDESPVTVGREIFESAHARAAGVTLAQLRAIGAIDAKSVDEFNRLMNWHKEIMWGALHDADFLQQAAKRPSKER